MDLLRFNRLNRWTGWGVFFIAAVVYLLTIEPSSSLWDCSEFVATSYKLEVGHPPGAPLFMLLARIATLLAPSPYYVPHMVNAMNAIASAFGYITGIVKMSERTIGSKNPDTAP